MLFSNRQVRAHVKLNLALEGYLQHHGEKIFFSPWKQPVSPVACAQPDK